MIYFSPETKQKTTSCQTIRRWSLIEMSQNALEDEIILDMRGIDAEAHNHIIQGRAKRTILKKVPYLNSRSVMTPLSVLISPVHLL